MVTTLQLTDRARSDFAVLIPAYNEAPNIEPLVAALKQTFDQFGLSGEVVLIDDGSTDDTAALADRAAAGWPSLRVVRHRRNLGKTEAMVTGAAATNRDVLVLFDADLQHLPDEIPRFLSKVDEGWDIVTGRKVGAYSKRGVSRVYNWMSRRAFDVPVSDLNSIKAFRRGVLDEITLRHDWHRYLVALAHSAGYSITEIDVELHPRNAGVSKFTGPFRVVVGLLDLLSVWFLLAFSKKPLMLFGSTGIALIGAGVVTAGVAFYFRFVLQQGFRPLLYLVVLLLTVGFILLLSGLTAELVAQLRAEVNRLRTDLAAGKGEADRLE